MCVQQAEAIFVFCDALTLHAATDLQSARLQQQHATRQDAHRWDCSCSCSTPSQYLTTIAQTKHQPSRISLLQIAGCGPQRRAVLSAFHEQCRLCLLLQRCQTSSTPPLPCLGHSCWMSPAGAVLAAASCSTLTSCRSCTGTDSLLWPTYHAALGLTPHCCQLKLFVSNQMI